MVYELVGSGSGVVSSTVVRSSVVGSGGDGVGRVVGVGGGVGDGVGEVRVVNVVVAVVSV